jgi:hypothetical protein
LKLIENINNQPLIPVVDSNENPQTNPNVVHTISEKPSAIVKPLEIIPISQSKTTSQPQKVFNLILNLILKYRLRFVAGVLALNWIRANYKKIKGL